MTVIDFELGLVYVIHNIEIVTIIVVDSDGNAEVVRETVIDFDVIDLETALALDAVADEVAPYVDDSNYALAA